MFEGFRRFIEDEDWDAVLSEGDRYLDWFCIAVVALSGLYFGGRLLIS
jgi:hypothetical protein